MTETSKTLIEIDFSESEKRVLAIMVEDFRWRQGDGTLADEDDDALVKLLDKFEEKVINFPQSPTGRNPSPAPVPMELSNRRLLELCLSRIPMHQTTARALMHNLQNEISKTRGTITYSPLDPETLLPVLWDILDDLSVDVSFSKKALVGRSQEAKNKIQKLIQATKELQIDSSQEQPPEQLTDE